MFLAMEIPPLRAKDVNASVPVIYDARCCREWRSSNRSRDGSRSKSRSDGGSCADSKCSRGYESAGRQRRKRKQRGRSKKHHCHHSLESGRISPHFKLAMAMRDGLISPPQSPGVVTDVHMMRASGSSDWEEEGTEVYDREMPRRSVEEDDKSIHSKTENTHTKPIRKETHIAPVHTQNEHFEKHSYHHLSPITDTERSDEESPKHFTFRSAKTRLFQERKLTQKLFPLLQKTRSGRKKARVLLRRMYVKGHDGKNSMLSPTTVDTHESTHESTSRVNGLNVGEGGCNCVVM